MNMRKAIPQFVGTRVKRREDPALITGQGKYVADIQLEGAADMGVVRSPHAHAKIRKIDTRAAESMAGVLAVLTGMDINPYLSKPLPVITEAGTEGFVELKKPERYPLTTGKVRHVGDPVAVVVAEDACVATDALEVIAVDYEPLPAVTDPEAALRDDAPILHEAWKDNRAFVWEATGGDVEAAFAGADTVVELRAVTQRLIPNAVEPRAVVAKYDPDTDQFTVWSTTQVPHQLREDLAGILSVSEERIRVIAPEVGGGFGAKFNVYGEEVLVPFLARRLNRPVRWVASRSEDYLATSHGRDQIDIIRLAVDREGRVRGAELKVIADCGAYYSKAMPAVPPLTGQMMTGTYDIPNARAEIVGVFTNKVAMEPYRGAGRPEAAYLIERAMDRLAQELDLDPVEVRRRNFIPPERFPYKTATGPKYDSGEYARALDEALRLVDYRSLREEQARRRREGGRPLGIGISCYVEICGFGPWEAGAVTVEHDGKVIVLSGTSPHGQGHETSWAQIAADTLQVPMEDIVVKHGDTATVPRGIGTFGSRSAPVGGVAVLQSARTVREQAKEIAAHLLEAAPVDMTLTGGKFHVVGVPGRSVSWKEIAAAAYDEDLPQQLQGSLSADTLFEPEGETFPFGTHVCVVEIDPDTGAIDIVRYLTVDDCGSVINPLLVEGQVHGGIAQGIGQALLEGAVYDESGNLLTGTLMDYALPRAHLLPRFEANRTETSTPLNALGAKGIGEAATIGSTPAVVNAVVDALSHLGVRHLDTPLTPQKIWQVLQTTRK
ncbi:MAG: xanthine dehydrogenase family protein molybdopterin-binding subunit, partial [Acidobacteriota bacterium]